MSFPVRRTRTLRIGLGLLLAGLALGTFWPATANRLVEYDDLEYVNDNPHVKSGLSADNVYWALTTTRMGNWHPLTWLSLMADATCWNNNPFGFHLTNVLLHTANVVLLYLALLGMTGLPIRSALVAGLFAVHPLNVESVAWVAERKGVLAAFFGLLALVAYVRYARRRSWLVYLAVVLFFALSLMAKAVTVTLPAALLLLDFWPLRRTPLPSAPPLGEGTAPAPVSWRRLLLEKVPLVLLSLGFSIVAPLAQRDAGALRSAEERPLLSRLANTLVNPLTYMRKLVWPSDLAVFYPYEQRSIFSVEVLGATLLLVAITALALWYWRRRSYLVVGWLWYLGLLFPVVGLVPVGGHSLADRYVYLPIIGVFIFLVWGTADGLAALRLRTLALPLSAAVLVSCVFWTREQLPYWHDPVTLWEHALAVTADNHRAYNNLGAHYVNTNRCAEAEPNLREAVRLRSDKADYHYNYGLALKGVGDLHGAAEEFHKAVELDPSKPLYRQNEEWVRHDLARQAGSTAP
jgi:hypothetical protein